MIIKKIADLTVSKNPIVFRQAGYEMICAIAEIKGEEAFTHEPMITKLITSMANDN